jgi:type IV pilus assembly protein PilZ
MKMVKANNKSNKSAKSSTNCKTKKTTSAKKKSSLSLSKDSRRDHRIPIQLLVDYKCNGHYLFDFCKDLGAGGVFIQTDNPLPQGSTIDLTFTIPDSNETLTTKGSVMWVQQEVAGNKELVSGMGVQFEAFDSTQRNTLQEFISRYNGGTSLIHHDNVA